MAASTDVRKRQRHGGGPFAMLAALVRIVRWALKRRTRTPEEYVRVRNPQGRAELVRIEDPQNPDPALTHGWVFRNRRWLVAVPVACGLAAVRFAAEYGAAGQYRTTATAVLCGAAAYVVWRRTHASAPMRLHVSMGTREVRLAIPAGRIASWCGWAYGSLYISSAVPPRTVILAALLAMGVRAWRFRIRKVDARPDLGPRTREETWQFYLSGGELAGTVLEGTQDLTDDDGTAIAWRGGVTGVRGKTTMGTYRSQLARIASAFDVTASQVTLEPGPSEFRCVVTVASRRELAVRTDRPMPTLDLRTGELGPLMMLADGTPANGLAFRPGEGAKDWWLYGRKRSGKSCLVDRVLAGFGRPEVDGVPQAGMVLPLLIDLKDGNSLPEWQDVVYLFGHTVAEAMRAIRLVELIMEERQADLRKRRARIQDPSPSWPLVALVIEEFTVLLGVPGAMERIEMILKLSGNVCIELVLITQPATLEDAFGGSGVVRAQLQGGNVVALASDHRSARTGLGGMAGAIDLSTIPSDAPGSGYLVSPVSTRQMIGRAPLTDPYEASGGARFAEPDPTVLRAQARLVDEQRTTAEREKQSEPEALTAASPVRDAVLDWLRAHPGEHAISEMVAEEIGSDSGIRTALNQLCNSGAVIKRRRGQYEAAEKG